MQRNLLERLIDLPLPEDSGRSVSISEISVCVSRYLENLLNPRSEGARLLPDTF
ncbi:MAG: hypothetical protein QM612_04070 [Thermomonas sp.]|uniref:hypothetical protein n=1 Tax=Thermomonas sp. TaxID=1971895 RepID=UPI0039E5004B